MTMGLGSVVSWSLGGECILMGEHRVVGLFGTMEASMVGLAKIIRISALKMFGG
jgi:hypothetical protein